MKCPKCPKCGADWSRDGITYTQYKCLTRVYIGGDIKESWLCKDNQLAALKVQYATLALGLRAMVERWRTASKQEWCEEGREAYEGCADELNAALDDAEGK